MKIKKYTNFKVEAIFVTIILLSLSTLIPASQGLALDEKQPSNPKNNHLGNTDFSITIHRIKQEDEMDPMPYDEADWRLIMYVDGVEKTYDCVGDDITLDETFTWEEMIQEDLHIDVDIRLMERDDWPGANDIADISAYAGGGIDDSNDFTRGAIFKRTYNPGTKDWKPENENNDYLQYEYDAQSNLGWYITSGNFDGSTTTDENDATIWFNISIGNRPPIAPTKPDGPDEGEVYYIYDFSTQAMDPDGDAFQFGWDWDGDYVIDELTDYYESWETATISLVWLDPGVYYLRVVAIDENGMIGGWSDPLVVRINGPGGMSGYIVEEWSLGHVYTLYLNEYETQNLVNTIQNAEYVIDAVAALIVAIAAACGYPLDFTIATAIAIAILQVGVAIIVMMDQGMGIYFRIYTAEINGVPLSFYPYIWPQTMGGSGNEDNIAPDKPTKLAGPARGSLNKEYTYFSSTTDNDQDRVFYIFDWGDGTFNFTDWYEPDETASFSHSWSKKGSYNLRIKAIDDHGAESAWSDPLPIKMPRVRNSNLLIMRLLERFPNAFLLLRYLASL